MRNKYVHILVLFIIALILVAIFFLFTPAPAVSDSVNAPDPHGLTQEQIKALQQMINK
mgnify:FL=1